MRGLKRHSARGSAREQAGALAATPRRATRLIARMSVHKVGTEGSDRPAPPVTSGPPWRYRMAMAATGG